MNPEELGRPLAGVVGRRFARSLERVSPTEPPAAWGMAERPGGYPIPDPQLPESRSTRKYYDVVWMPRVEEYRDLCTGLDAEVQRQEPDQADLFAVETETGEQHFDFTNILGSPAGKWCRGDVAAALRPGADDSALVVEFRSTFEIEPREEEQLIEIGYAAQIDASYRVASTRRSKGNVGVVAQAGLEGSALSEVGKVDLPYEVGGELLFQKKQVDLEGDAVILVPAAATATTVALAIEISQYTYGAVEATLTTKRRSGVIVFRSVSRVTYEREVKTSVYDWPPSGIPPRPFPGPWR